MSASKSETRAQVTTTASRLSVTRAARSPCGLRRRCRERHCGSVLEGALRHDRAHGLVTAVEAVEGGGERHVTRCPALRRIFRNRADRSHRLAGAAARRRATKASTPCPRLRPRSPIPLHPLAQLQPGTGRKRPQRGRPRSLCHGGAAWPLKDLVDRRRGGRQHTPAALENGTASRGGRCAVPAHTHWRVRSCRPGWPASRTGPCARCRPSSSRTAHRVPRAVPEG